MNGTITYFLLGGVIFIVIFIIFFYFAKKLKKYFGKKYVPESASSFKCIDGHKVRSKAELIIDNYLYNHGIVHEYEKKIVDIVEDDIRLFKGSQDLDDDQTLIVIKVVETQHAV